MFSSGLHKIEAWYLAMVSKHISLATAAELNLKQKNSKCMVLEEFKDIIELPSFDAHVSHKEVDPYSIRLAPKVKNNALTYVRAIAYMYHDNLPIP